MTSVINVQSREKTLSNTFGFSIFSNEWVLKISVNYNDVAVINKIQKKKHSKVNLHTMVVLKFSLCIINANNTTLNNALLMLSTKQMLFLLGRTRFDPVIAVTWYKCEVCFSFYKK